MKNWLPLQWCLFALIIALVAVPVVANWCFPRECYPTGERIVEEGPSHKVYHGEAWECVPDPSNPEWVKFIQNHDDSMWVVIPVCIALGCLIARIGNKREVKLLREQAAILWDSEIDLLDQKEHPVKWYREQRKKGISTDDLVELCSRVYDGEIPPAIKREITRERDLEA